MTGDELRKWMEDMDLNPKRLAAFLEVSDRAIYHWLKGTRKIPRYLCLQVKEESVHEWLRKERIGLRKSNLGSIG